MKNVTIFGDSILRAVLYGEDKRYHISNAVDWSEIERRLDVKITNKSRMGCTVEKGNRIIDKTLSKVDNIDVAIVEYGGNDSDFNWFDVAENPDKLHNSYTDIEIFKSKLTDIIKKLKTKNIKPVLMTLPPIDSLKYFDKIADDTKNGQEIMKFLGDKFRIYRYQEAFSNAVATVAIKNNVELIDIRSAFLLAPNYRDLICLDGIHPNINGENLIVDTIVNYYCN